MLSAYAKATAPKSVPQSAPLDKRQVRNAAGGFVYQLDDFARAKRFLILGSAGGTYYVGESKLTLENADCLRRVVAAGRGKDLVEEVVAVSVAGRAPKQGPGLFALALVTTLAPRLGHSDARAAALAALPRVARTASSLFEFVAYCDLIAAAAAAAAAGADAADATKKTKASWGRGMRNAIADWYLRDANGAARDPLAVAYQVTKYGCRAGYTHRDLLRLAHPDPERLRRTGGNLKRAHAAPAAAAAAARPAKLARAEPTAAPPASTSSASSAAEDVSAARLSRLSLDEWEIVGGNDGAAVESDKADSDATAAAKSAASDVADVAKGAAGDDVTAVAKSTAGDVESAAAMDTDEDGAAAAKLQAKLEAKVSGFRTLFAAIAGRAPRAANEPAAEDKAAPAYRGAKAVRCYLKDADALKELRADDDDAAERAVALMRKRHFGREHVGDTRLLREPALWASMLADGMPLGALLRSLGRMTAVGAFKFKQAGAAPLDAAVSALRDARRVRGARLHPISVLAAMRTYAAGRGELGATTWDPEPAITHALEAAFDASFGTCAPTGKRILIGLDVSGSMDFNRCLGTPALTCRDAAMGIALALVRAEAGAMQSQDGSSAAAKESACAPRGGGKPRVQTVAFTTRLEPFAIRAHDALQDVIRRASRLPFGGTDCAQPVLGALKARERYDAFVVLTDNETWAGGEHPTAALKRYRAALVPDAKLCVMAFASTGWSIADPDDAGMLDVAGVDGSVPGILHDFLVQGGDAACADVQACA